MERHNQLLVNANATAAPASCLVATGPPNPGRSGIPLHSCSPCPSACWCTALGPSNEAQPGPQRPALPSSTQPILFTPLFTTHLLAHVPHRVLQLLHGDGARGILVNVLEQLAQRLHLRGLHQGDREEHRVGTGWVQTCSSGPMQCSCRHSCPWSRPKTAGAIAAGWKENPEINTLLHHHPPVSSTHLHVARHHQHG